MPADTAEPLSNTTATELSGAADADRGDSAQPGGSIAYGDEGHGVKLNFINKSNDRNNSMVVIFGKNAVTTADELAVAWKVIQNCGVNWNHPFIYPLGCEIGASDSWGNCSPALRAQNGQAFSIALTPSGDAVTYAGPASSASEIELRNDLPVGAINAVIYKRGRAYATRTSIAPGQKAAFSFKPTIWIGVVSQVEEGEVMNSAILSMINTELSLLGVASADIVMTGGGPGRAATPFAFNLENVVFA